MTGIECRKLSLAIGKKTILDSMDLSFAQSGIHTILGPNGAGKSTLLRLLAGLSDPSTGTITIEGQPLAELSKEDQAKRIGFVPQRTQLTAPLPVKEVVAMGRFAHRGDAIGLSRQDRDVVTDCLGRCDCTHLAEQNFNTCSVGEQARILIARALATEAPYLFLDEPAASLDISHSLHLEKLLITLANDGRGIILVHHNLDTVKRLSTTCTLLCCGQHVASGGPEEVLSSETIQSVYSVIPHPDTATGYSLVERP